jgi:hypothetical protein
MDNYLPGRCGKNSLPVRNKQDQHEQGQEHSHSVDHNDMDLPRKEIGYHLLSVDYKIRACAEHGFVATCPLKLFITSDLVPKLIILLLTFGVSYCLTQNHMIAI